MIFKKFYNKSNITHNNYHKSILIKHLIMSKIKNKNKTLISIHNNNRVLN